MPDPALKGERARLKARRALPQECGLLPLPSPDQLVAASSSAVPPLAVAFFAQLLGRLCRNGNGNTCRPCSTPPLGRQRPHRGGIPPPCGAEASPGDWQRKTSILRCLPSFPSVSETPRMCCCQERLALARTEDPEGKESSRGCTLKSAKCTESQELW